MKDGDSPLKTKNKKWIKPRHYLIRELAGFVLAPFCKWMYGSKVQPFQNQSKRPYLILYNHQTPFDQFFVGLAFKGPVYYVSTEDLYSRGWVSALLRWAVAPIPIKKQASDVGAVRTCMRVAREGGTIAIAPEGNRTYSGKTEYMSPAIATLARVLKMPIALLRIEGGYGVHPRWSDGRRKGHVRAYVSQVIEPETYAEWSNEELFQAIAQGLHVDDYAPGELYLAKRKAEYLERAMYVCPDCGLTSYESNGNEAHCCKCGKAISYGEDMKLTGIGHDFPFATMTQWYDYQKDFVNALDVTRLVDEPIYEESADVSEIVPCKSRTLLRKSAALRLYGDRMTVQLDSGEPLCMTFDDIFAAAVLGRNKLNIYYQNHLYQFKGDKRFNALKYVNFCYRWKNKDKGEPDGKFLGL